MKKFVGSMVLAVAVVGLPLALSGLTGCQENNTAEQIEGGEAEMPENMEEMYEKAEKEQDQPPADQ